MVSLQFVGVLVVCVGILLVAAELRFHQLWKQSLWNDEGSSYVQATRTFAEIAENAARDIHPPGYYWLLAVWRGVAGESEFALRSVSVFASLLSVALTFAIGRRLFGTAAGLVAALLVALNSFSIYYAQEARMYALLAMWAAAGMWLVVAASYQLSVTSKTSIRWIVALGLVNAAGLYTQYAYPFVMLAQGVVVVIGMGRAYLDRTRHASTLPQAIDVRLVMFVAANLLTIVLYSPWLPTALRQVTQWPSTGAPIAASEALGTIVGWFALGITYKAVPNASGYLPLALVLLMGGVVGWVWLNLRSPSPPLPEGERGLVSKSLWKLSVPVVWVGLPVVLFLILGLFRPANLKFLLPSQIGLALLMGAGLGGWLGLARRGFRSDRITLAFMLLQAGWLVAYLVNGLTPLFDDSQFQRPDYRGMVQQITSDARDGDAIILDAPNQEEVFRYYYRGSAPIYPLPAGLGGDDMATLEQVRDIIAKDERIFVLFWGEAERDPNHVVETTLDNETFSAGDDQWFGDVRLARYVTPVEMPEGITANARFGDSIMLERYATSTTALQTGDVLQVRLEWQTQMALTTRFKVFVQLLNGDGALVAQRDSEPSGNSRPTTSWAVGETVVDQHGLVVPNFVAAGEYKVIVGLYNIDDPNQRLQVDGGSFLEIARVTVR
ncbi:MAG: glycosyltransferase family 39 protein [Anaerolineae bacterium]